MNDRGRMIELRVEPTRIRRLKELPRHTVFAGKDAETVVYLPTHSPGRAAATEFRKTMQAKWNVDLRIADCPPEPGAAAPRTAIAVGHAGNNPIIRQLHDRGFLGRADYPFGGRHIRTFHDVDGTGTNIVTVLGRREPALRTGCGRLIDAVVDLGNSSLGLAEPLVDTAPGEMPDDPADFVRQTENHLREGAGGRPSSFLTALSRLRRTGDPRWARAFLSVLAPYATGEVPLSFWLMSAVDFWTDRLVLDWTVVEPMPCFTDEDRLTVANFIASCTEYCHDSITYQKWRITPDDHQVFNHHTFPARSLFFGCRFLAARCLEPPPGIAAWTQKALTVFERAAAAGRSFDEGGAGYSWLVGTHLLDVELARGNDDFARSQRLKHYADLAVMVQNSRFEMVPFGDCGSYHAKGGGAAEILLRAARWHADPGCKWMVRQAAPEICRTDPFCATLRARPPADHVGLKILPMDPVVQRWSARPAFPGYPPPLRMPNVEPEHGFDKITLRGGWNRDDDYLLLQGFGSGQHGHPDANAISQYQVRQRLFLVDCDYIRRHPANHNTVMIVADGVHNPPPITARLDETASFPGGAVTRTSLIDYNGCDWQRTILWFSGEYILAVDSVVPRTEADLDLRCYWRTLGTVTQTPGGMRTEHSGEWAHLTELTESDTVLVTEPPPLNTPDYPPYEFGDSRPVVLCRRRRLRAEIGRPITFVTLVAPSGTSEHPIHVGRLEPDGAVTVSRPGFCTRITPQSISVGNEVIHRFNTPLSLPARDSAKPRVRNHGPADAPVPACIRSRKLRGAPTACHTQTDAVWIGTDRGQVVRVAHDGQAAEFAAVGGQVNAVLEAKLYGEDRPSLLVTGTHGRLDVFATDGELRMSIPLQRNHHMPAHGRALCVADLDGDGTHWPIVGTASWRVHAIAPDGSSRWTFETAAHAVNCLTAGDLNHDGRDEIAVGTVYFCVPAITADGMRLWEDEDYNDFWRAGPDFRIVHMADIDGDGDLEVVTAASDTLVHCIDRFGNKKWTASIGDDCAGLAVENGTVWAASRDGAVLCFDGRGRQLYRKVLGAECTALAARAGRACAATDDGRVVVLNPDCTIAAATRPQPAPVSHLAWLDDHRLISIAHNGTIQWLDLAKDGSEAT